MFKKNVVPNCASASFSILIQLHSYMYSCCMFCMYSSCMFCMYSSCMFWQHALSSSPFDPARCVNLYCQVGCVWGWNWSPRWRRHSTWSAQVDTPQHLHASTWQHLRVHKNPVHAQCAQHKMLSSVSTSLVGSQSVLLPNVWRCAFAITHTMVIVNWHLSGSSRLHDKHVTIIENL